VTCDDGLLNTLTDLHQVSVEKLVTGGMVGWQNSVVAHDRITRRWGNAAKISRAMQSGIDGALQ
jgi:hypothetical protein